MYSLIGENPLKSCIYDKLRWFLIVWVKEGAAVDFCRILAFMFLVQNAKKNRNRLAMLEIILFVSMWSIGLMVQHWLL